ncbi:MAG: L,D-transpeptidase, partial [Myxococcales bacterium]
MSRTAREQAAPRGLHRSLAACPLAVAALGLTACSRPPADHGAPAASVSAGGPAASAAAGASFSSPPPPHQAPAAGARLGALAWETTVRERPSDKAKALGYLRAGSVVAASAQPVGREGCGAGWYKLEPEGFVCADPSNATTDVEHEIVRAMSRRPDTLARMPYAYGIVRRGGPVFGRLPTGAQAEASEPGFEARLKEWLAAPGEDGAGFRAEHWLAGRTAPPASELWGQHTTREVPWFLADGRAPPANLSGYPPAGSEGIVLARTKHHNGFAFVDSAVSEGRRYAISTQLFLVPVDRLRPVEGSSYHGVEIPGEMTFPFALVRRAGPLMRADGKKLVRERDVERRAALKLSGKQKKFGDRLYFETADGLWISDQHASRLDPAKKMPKWGKQGEHWLDVNISKQTLVAYDGTRAVYATLV